MRLVNQYEEEMAALQETNEALSGSLVISR